MPFAKSTSLAVSLCLTLLSACGGGGTDGPPGPQDQTISFAVPITASGAVGTTVTNTASGGAGTGAISYNSSNSGVATVSGTGTATLLAVGSTTITATKAASSGFNSATASYTLNVTQGTQTIAFAQTGPLQVALTGGAVINIALGGAGIGAISYTTSNAGVVAVDTTSGTATPLGVGTVTITAIKAADANYQQATATYTLNVTRGVQSIAFAQAGPLQALSGATINNIASGGVGTGAIGYVSSDTSVMVVDAATGAATALNAGTATITATKAIDANYSQAQAAYVVTVQNRDQAIAFAIPGAASGVVGTTVTNTAGGGDGSGAISYFSSNSLVAPVNPTTGVATLMSVGSTTITATKAASIGFNQATATYTLTVLQGSQTIAFAQAGPLQVLKGLAVTNVASGGAGTGAITYASSNTAAITVNAASGVATAVGTGSATITATKAADANYSQAQASYLLTVQTLAPVGAWIGSSDSQVTLPSVANGTQFIRSRDRNCNLANYSVCTNGQANMAAGTTITDTAATTGATGYYWLQSGGRATNALPINAKRFSERIGHTALFFNNRYWVIGGGALNYANVKNDVWSSADGKTWELETSNANFSPRWFHQSVVYSNKMWVIGGGNALDALTNDVWSSTDGVNWTQVSASLPFGSASAIHLNVAVFNGAMWAVSNGSTYSSTDGIAWTLRTTASAVGGSWRAFASLTAYGGKLWYIGGAPNFYDDGSSGTAVNDVWSYDGSSWTQVTANAAFAPRYQHTSFVMNNKLWVFGGENVTNGVNGLITADAWSTTDGITWIPVTAATAIDRSYLVATVQETNKVTLIGGLVRGYSNQVWQSTNGNQWTELSPFAQFSPRIAAGAVTFQGDLWVIGGYAAESTVSNELWRSSDGLTWTRVTPIGPLFSPRAGHEALVFNGRLWVIGGWDEPVNDGGTNSFFNDVWSSADGINWTQHMPAGGTVFSPRAGHQAVAFNNKLWVIGGGTATGHLNDVWSTTNGTSWVQETAGAAFAARVVHRAAVFGNALWIIGGESSGTVFSDVWKSTDGATWNLVTPVGPSFAARTGHAMAVYNSRLWLIGGWNGLFGNAADYLSGVRFNDVWSTADGVTWRRDTPAAQFDPRREHHLVVHDNELWLIGGYNLDLNNEIWRSTDGVNWRVGFSSSFTTP